MRPSSRANDVMAWNITWRPDSLSASFHGRDLFAPVATLQPIDTIDEAIAKANNTHFGLAAYVMTNDLSAAFKMAEGLEFGTIGINDTVPASPQLPFGGIKESGIGRENAIEGLDVYLETKAVSLAINE